MASLFSLFLLTTTMIAAPISAPTTGPTTTTDSSKVLRPTDPVSAPVRPTDIYADYYDAKRVWASQQVAKVEIQNYVAQQKQAIAFELKVSEGVINVEGPSVSDEGNICTNYSVDRSNLPVTNISDISPRMEALANTLNQKNDAPVSGTNITSTHYRSLASDSNTKIQLLNTCLTPDKL